MVRKRRKVRGPRSDGSRKLDGWLTRMSMSVPAFCDAHGLDRLKIQRILSGDTQNVRVELAFAIEDATAGFVKAKDFKESTSRTERDSSPPPPRTGTDDS